MRPWLLMTLLGPLAIAVAPADEPVRPDSDDACLMLNNRILGPRSGDRPLPLLSGDPARGFRAACAVPWSALSPKNQALPIVGCFRGNLLQLANNAACGKDTGPLWVSARWVVTSAELQHHDKQVAVCQQLETNAWAGTRDFKLDCQPRKKQGTKTQDERPKPAATKPDR